MSSSEAQASEGGLFDDPPSLLFTAMDYAAFGWPVFPCRPRGKQPMGSLAPHGLHDATTDVDVVQSWWERVPQANIGLRTGIAFDVVDIDGPEGLAALNVCRRDRPVTWGPEVSTGGDGWHLYHQPTGAGNRTRIVAGVDFRGAGGYVIAPPSVHATGKPYTWQPLAGWDEPLEPLPDWLLELVVHEHPSAPPTTRLPATRLHEPARLGAYARRALESELGQLVMAPVGSRNDQLNRAAFALGQLVGAGMLGAEEVAAELLEAARRIGLTEREAARTVASGMRKGMQQPRRVPA